jgi:hypothetical protein
MSRLADLQRDLQDASAAVAHAEKVLAAHPNVPSVAATLRTIERRRASLEEQFFAAADELGLDACGYRIEYEGSTASISGLTAVLNTFQRIFTNVYESLETGRKKQRARVSDDSVAATQLGFAYTFPGSVGVMMTLKNEQHLFEAKLDEAMKKTLELISSTDSEHVQAITDVVGLPAVRLAHQWAQENIEAGFGADIVWRRDDVVKKEVRVQMPQIAKLASAIKFMSAKEDVVLTGEILDVDIIDHSFRMKVGEKIINGTFDQAISQSHPVQMPKIYKATLVVSQRVVLDETGEERIEYHLIKLEAPDAPQSVLLPSV